LLFEDTSLRLYPNQLHFLVGESGTGKSTLLKILSKRINVQRVYCSLPIWHQLDSDQLAYQLIGYQLIDHSFMQHLTVAQNIEETKKAYHCSDIEKDLIGIFHFEKLLKKYPQQLSGGQKRMLSIILSLMKNLPIILLDEPTSSLDQETKEIFLKYLKAYARQGHIVLVATNDEEIKCYADKIIQIEGQKLQQELRSEQNSLSIQSDSHQVPYRLKTILYHQPWYQFVQLCLIVAITVFLGHSFYTASDTYCAAKTSIQKLQQTYSNTAYVYYESFVDSEDYYYASSLLDNGIGEMLSKNSNIKKVYPYYAFPLGMIHNSEFATESTKMTLSSECIHDIDLTNENVFMEFYYPEQLAGEKIYISESFLEQNNLALKNVQDIQLDAAVPIDFDQNGGVTQLLTDASGKVIEVSIPSVKTIYRKEKMNLHIDDIHHIRCEMYSLSDTPLIYAPYSLMENYIDTATLPTNAYVLILEDNANITDLRKTVLDYDEKLIFSYPPQTNQHYVIENQNWLTGQMKVHFLTTIISILCVGLFLILLEVFNKNDYLYLRYSGLSEKRYIRYRMIEAGIIVALISVSSLVYALIFKEFPISFSIASCTYIGFIFSPLLIYSWFIHFFYRRLKI